MVIRFGRHRVDTKGKTEAEIEVAIQKAFEAAFETQEEDSKIFLRRQRRLLKAYELRYEMSTAEMHERWNQDESIETGDLCMWNAVWFSLSPREILTTGTPSETMIISTKSA